MDKRKDNPVCSKKSMVVLPHQLNVAVYTREVIRMAKTNYSYEKRGRELEKQKKQEEKRQKKRNKKNSDQRDETSSESGSSVDDPVEK